LIARCWAFIGPHLPLDTHFAAGNFLRNALDSSTIQIGGDGTAERSYLYAADLAIWLWTILVKAPPLRAYNVGSGQAVSIRGLAEVIANQQHPALPIAIAKLPVPGASPARYVPCVRRASELGLAETISLEDAVQRTLKWLREE
jgi:dTDP-glucose 4,6-dehydratase